MHVAILIHLSGSALNHSVGDPVCRTLIDLMSPKWNASPTCQSNPESVLSPAGIVFLAFRSALSPQHFTSVIGAVGVNHAGCFKLESVCSVSLDFWVGQHGMGVL